LAADPASDPRSSAPAAVTAITSTPSAPIGTATARGLLWAYGSYIGGRLIVLGSIAVLAHVLAPSDFGLVALAIIVTDLLYTLSDLGLSQALVVEKEEEVLERAETAFVWSVGAGAGLSLTAIALSPLAARFFHEPELAAILSVLGLNFFIRSLGTTHYAIAQKRLDFRTRSIAELSNATLRGGLGIVLALAGFGAWSLVIGYLAGTFVLVVALWILVPWRPSFRTHPVHRQKLLRFGGTLTGVDVLAAVTATADYIFVGRVLGTAALGFYTLAFRLPELLVINLAIVAGTVLFPSFANVDRAVLGRSVLVSLRYMLMFALPLSAAMVVLAEPIILELFGPGWEETVPVLQVLSLYALAKVIGIPAGVAYKATGRADILLKLAIPHTIVQIAVLAVVVDNGIVWVAAAMFGVSAAFTVLDVAIAQVLFDLRLGQLWDAVWPPLAATVGMTAVLIALERTIEAPWPLLIGGGLLGTVTYAGLLWLTAPDSLVSLVQRVRAAAA
jgi:O-antigen/teichoic acid export membrane protein